jgi:hypothetical protein
VAWKFTCTMVASIDSVVRLNVDVTVVDSSVSVPDKTTMVGSVNCVVDGDGLFVAFTQVIRGCVVAGMIFWHHWLDRMLAHW